jgi:hypothetical protein
VPRSPQGSGLCILLRVSRDGLSPLDLKLVATEGLNPYVGAGAHYSSSRRKIAIPELMSVVSQADR